MKLSDLRPCDNCGGAIAPIFNIVKTSIAVINTGSANKTLGLAQYFGEGSAGLALAEVMGDQSDAVKIGSEHAKELETEIFLCQECHMTEINLAVIVEKIAARNTPTEEAAEDQT